MSIEIRPNRNAISPIIRVPVPMPGIRINCSHGIENMNSSKKAYAVLVKAEFLDQPEILRTAARRCETVGRD
jgi:hypothetical protein